MWFDTGETPVSSVCAARLNRLELTDRSVG
jgi:hypothetical protein